MIDHCGIDGCVICEAVSWSANKLEAGKVEPMTENKLTKNIGTKPPINIGAFKTGKLVYTDDGQAVTSWVTLHMPRFYHDECLVLPHSTFKYKEDGETNRGEFGEFVTSSKFDFHSWDRWEVVADEA